MATCNDSAFLAECLIDPYALVCCSCEEAKRLRCIALARLRELSCSCMSSPIQIGSGEGLVRYPSPVEAMDALRRMIEMTYTICEQAALEEGPVIATIWQDRCGRGKWSCSTTCSTDPYWYRYHLGESCEATEPDPDNNC